WPQSPASYQSPLVLCYFEGKTHEEAARQLGWPLGTVRTRVARARDTLRGRLERRGLGLPGSLLGAALLMRTARAALPFSLAKTTLSAGVAVALGRPFVGLVSAQVAGLIEGALIAMSTTKFLLTATLLLTAGISLVALTRSGGVTPSDTPQTPAAVQANENGAKGPGGNAKDTHPRMKAEPAPGHPAHAQKPEKPAPADPVQAQKPEKGGEFL